MRTNIIALVLGIWLLQQQAVLPDPAWLAGSSLGIGLLYLRTFQISAHPLAAQLLAKAFWLLLGVTWATVWAQQRLADTEFPSISEGPLTLTGHIAEMPSGVDGRVATLFDVDHAEDPGLPQRIFVTWRGVAAEELRAGSRWRLTVRLRVPHGLSNPSGFDLERWAFERGIAATGYVVASERLSDGLSPRYWIQAIRQRVAETMWDRLGDRPMAGVLVALAVGDQKAIPSAQWEVFMRTGVNHLMAISGLHVGLVAGLFYLTLFQAWRRSTRLLLWVPARKAAVVAGLGAALAYALIAGFAIPTQRTVLMLTVVAIALWTDRAFSASRVLSLAMAIVVLADPLAVLAPGFWLSFGAVALMLFVGTGRQRTLGGWRAAGAVQWAVTIGFIPVLLLLFQQFSLVSPLANALAIPVVSWGVVPLTLTGAAIGWETPLVIAHALMEWVYWVLRLMSGWDHATWSAGKPGFTAALLGVGGALWILMPRGVPARWLGVVCLLPLVFPPLAQMENGAVELAVLDVGQGTAAVVRTRHHAMLYDAGPPIGAHGDAGERVIVPFLRGIGVTSLDAVILSHDDADHTGGATSVINRVAVGALLSSLPSRHALHHMVKRSARCQAGQRWTWDGVDFEMLSPIEEAYHRVEKDNEMSCVLRVSSPGGSFLLTGDVERGGEDTMVRNHGTRLRSDIVMVPHHGSRTSSTEAFLDRVQPNVAIFPVGHSNRYGHPKAEVVARYRARRVPLFRTDTDGAIVVRIRPGLPIDVTTYRSDHRRYWARNLNGA